MSLAEFLADHTFRTVALGTMLIGLMAGAIGTFAYLRKQSLMSDVISHAALPGSMLAFLVGVLVLGGDGRDLWALVAGAVVTGTLAVWAANAVTRHTRLGIEAAMAATLSVFFAVGIILLRIIEDRPLPGKGGLQGLLFGNAATLTRADLVTVTLVGCVVLGVLLVSFQQFASMTFDSDHATVAGARRWLVDGLMFTTLVVVTVVGAKAVGLVLMVALVITPPAAARQWTSSLRAMTLLSAGIGAFASAVGAWVSIRLGSVPTGPVIVLVLFAILLVSLLCSPSRSVLVRALRRARVRAALRRELGATS